MEVEAAVAALGDLVLEVGLEVLVLLLRPQVGVVALPAASRRGAAPARRRRRCRASSCRWSSSAWPACCPRRPCRRTSPSAPGRAGKQAGEQGGGERDGHSHANLHVEGTGRAINNRRRTLYSRRVTGERACLNNRARRWHQGRWPGIIPASPRSPDPPRILPCESRLPFPALFALSCAPRAVRPFRRRRADAAEGLHRPLQRQGPRRLARVGIHAKGSGPYDLAKLIPGASGRSRSPSGPPTPRSTGRVENGELVNDGNGAYLTTDKDYGDIELLIDYKTVAEGRQRHLPPRPRRRCRSGTTTKEGGKWDLGADKGSGGLWNNSPGAPGQRPARPGRQAVRRVEPASASSRSASATTVYLNDKLVVDHARLENYWDRKPPLPREGADPAPDPRRRDPLAEHLRPRDPADEANEILAQARRDGLRRRLQRQGLHRLGRAGRELRGRGRRDRLQAEEGRQHLHEGRVRRLRRPRRVQAAARRQQRPGDPLPRQGRRRVRRHVRAADPRRRRPASTPSSTRGSTTARPTAWSPPSAATCGRSASGTSRR